MIYHGIVCFQVSKLSYVMPSAQKTQLEHLDFTYPVAAPWYLMFDP